METVAFRGGLWASLSGPHSSDRRFHHDVCVAGVSLIAAGVLALASVWGYAQMARDAGQNVGGGSRRQRA